MIHTIYFKFYFYIHFDVFPSILLFENHFMYYEVYISRGNKLVDAGA